MTSLSTQPLDLQDERLKQNVGLKGEVQGFITRVRAGDLGVLPVVIGVILIATVFQSLNPFFLSSDNLVNLALELVPVGVIALGIVFVLLLGEIDLSVGSVAGLGSAITAILLTRFQWPIFLCILVALAVGAAIGLIYALFFVRFGVPSFVVTLAGLLAVLGMQLWVLGPTASVNIPFDSPVVMFAQQMFLPPWLAYTFSALAGLLVILSGLASARRRKKEGLSVGSLSGVVIRGIVLAVILGILSWYFALTRGMPLMFVCFVILIIVAEFFLKRTRWGRSIYAVGGNVEAARRSGIRVNRIYVSVFLLCSLLATIGGILISARLAAASPSTGGGTTNLNAIAAAVIGGTSLFGGRGSAYAALLGIIVIQAISSGLTLLSLESAIRFMITGAVLLIAVMIDALSRRSRSAHGAA